MSHPSDETTKDFYNIINSNDWDDLEDVVFNTDESPVNLGKEIFLGSYLLPTPFPGLWINFNVGFEIEDGDENRIW